MLSARTISTKQSIEFTSRSNHRFELGRVNFWNLDPNSDEEADAVLVTLHDGEYKNEGLDAAYPIIRNNLFNGYEGLYETYSGIDRDRGTNQLQNLTGDKLEETGLKVIGVEITGIPRSILDPQMQDFSKALRVYELLKRVPDSSRYQDFYLDTLEIHTSIQKVILGIVQRLKSGGVLIELHNMNTYHPSNIGIQRGQSLEDLLAYTESYISGERTGLIRQNCLVTPIQNADANYNFSLKDFSERNNALITNIVSGFTMQSPNDQINQWSEGNPYSMRPDYFSTQLVSEVIRNRRGSALIVDLLKDLFFKPGESYNLNATPDRFSINRLSTIFSTAIERVIRSPQPTFSPDQPILISP